MSLGSKIIALRKRKGMKQIELAQQLNVHQSMVTRWEKDQIEPRQETLKKLSEVLEIDINELVTSQEHGRNQEFKLSELWAQLHKLSSRDLDALKSVIEAMLTRARVQEAIGA